MEPVVVRFGEILWPQYCMELLRNLNKAIWPPVLQLDFGFFDYDAGMQIA